MTGALILLLWMALGGQLYSWWPPLCFAYFAATFVVIVWAKSSDTPMRREARRRRP